MIVTTTSLIPNEEIKCIISVVHNRFLLEVGLFNGFSTDKLTMTTNDLIEGLTKKALELNADALIDLKVDYCYLSQNQNRLVITAIGTAVLLKTK